MTLEILAALAMFAFASSITPGPNNIMLMTSGANFGLKNSMPHLLGVGLGFSLMLVLVGIGVMTLLDCLPGGYLILQAVCVIYLLYLAFKIATSRGSVEIGKAHKPMSFIQAALFQWVNPKGWSMALTAVTIYAPDRNLYAVLFVALVFCIVNIPSCGVWVLAGKSLTGWLSKPGRLQIYNVSMASLLVLSLYPLISDYI